MKLPRELGLLLALVVLGGVLAAARPEFLSAANLLNLLRQCSINGLLAVGATFVLLTGGVDLSLGSVVALAGVLAALAGPGWAIFAGLAAGGACGLLNGWLVSAARIAPFIVTLGMMTAARGLALVASGGRPVSRVAPELQWLGSGGAPIALLLAVSALAYVLLAHTKSGRYLYAVGGNEAAARASGLAVGRVKRLAYTLCGALAGLAGLVLAGRITTGQPNAGAGYELDAIAAVVMGGTSLQGGSGGIAGTLAGVLLLAVLNNGMDLLNVSAYYQQIAKGVIIVGAIGLDLSRKKS